MKSRWLQMGVFAFCTLVLCAACSLSFWGEVWDDAMNPPGTPTPAATPAPEATPTPAETQIPPEEPTPTPQPGRLVAPLGMTAKPGVGLVSLSWQKVIGARFYRVYRGNMEAALEDVEGTSYEATDLPNDTEWCFWVAGVDEYGTVGRKASACATPTFPKPVALVGIETSPRWTYGKGCPPGNAGCFANGQAFGYMLRADYGDQIVPSDVDPILDGYTNNKHQDMAKKWCTDAKGFSQIAWTLKHSSGAAATLTPAPHHKTKKSGTSNCVTTGASGKLTIGWHPWNAGGGNSILVVLGGDLPSGSVQAEARCLVDPKLVGRGGFETRALGGSRKDAPSTD